MLAIPDEIKKAIRQKKGAEGSPFHYYCASDGGCNHNV